MNVKTLSAVVGHASAGTILNIYTHVTESMARQATAKIDWGIGGQTGTPIPEIDSRSAPYQDFTVNPGKLRKPGTGCASQIKRLSVGGRYSPRWPNGRRYTRTVYAQSSWEEC